MYLTYSEYKMNGGLIDDNATFTKLEKRAEAEIDYHTFGRLKNKEIPNEVKNCIVELIDTFKDKENNITSFSNDGVSISYATDKEIKSQISNIINIYLSNTIVEGKKLLYRGVYQNDNI